MEEKQISISGRGEGRQIGVEFERRKTGLFFFGGKSGGIFFFTGKLGEFFSWDENQVEFFFFGGKSGEQNLSSKEN